MSRTKLQFTQKNFKIAEIQQQKLDELLAQGSFVTESDIMRQGIDMVHRKYMPPYLQPTPAGEIKIEKAKKEKIFRAIPDEEYVRDNLEDVMLFEDDEKQKWVLFRKQGNYMGAVLLQNIKDWVKNDPEYRVHLEFAGNSAFPYEEDLQDKTKRNWMIEHYGVAIAPLD